MSPDELREKREKRESVLGRRRVGQLAQMNLLGFHIPGPPPVLLDVIILPSFSELPCKIQNFQKLLKN